MSDYDKEKAAHDYLVKTVKFNQGAQPGDLAHTPYGALVQGSAVCDGYSTAFNLMMKLMGVECELVYGRASYNGYLQPHAWNRIKIEGKYYHIDVTWDDPVPDKGDAVSYTYFNLTDKAIAKDHQMLVPTSKKSESLERNYFQVMGTLARSQAEAENMISKALSAGTGIVLKGDGVELKDIDLRALLKAQNKSVSIQYSINEAQNILEIVVK
jgi:hypothetical protein